MAATKYTYSIADDFPNSAVDSDKLKIEIQDSDITIAIDYINTSNDDCDIWFKDSLSTTDSTVTLPAVIAVHDGVPIPTEDVSLRTDDGRLIVRADSRPIDFQTYYTMVGDDSTAGIGMGKDIMWDFTNDDDLVTGDHVPSGMKCKEFLIQFLCPIYTKDGCLYFFDAPWGQYACMDIVIPPGQYYPNPYGGIPAGALGLTGDDYGYTGSDYVVYCAYMMKYRMHGDCPMGDELNAEGSAINPIPIGWIIRGRIYTPTSDNVSKGYAELELHRCHTSLMPGQTLQDLANEH